MDFEYFSKEFKNKFLFELANTENCLRLGDLCISYICSQDKQECYLLYYEDFGEGRGVVKEIFGIFTTMEEAEEVNRRNGLCLSLKKIKLNEPIEWRLSE
jgi:hypothetical protein